MLLVNYVANASLLIRLICVQNERTKTNETNTVRVLRETVGPGRHGESNNCTTAWLTEFALWQTYATHESTVVKADEPNISALM